MVQTIETIDDFLRILRERPDIRDAVRREILTEELLALPGVVAGIAETQAEHTRELMRHAQTLTQLSKMLTDHTRMLMDHSEAIAGLTQTVAGLSQKQEEQTETIAGLTQTVGGLTQTVAGLVQKQEEHTEAIAGLTQTVGGLAQKQETIEGLVAETKSLRSDIGGLKGLYAMMQVERRFALIADEMGMEPVRLLDEREMLRFSRSETALREYDVSERESFRNCDLMIEADSPDEGECYIAVQVSYTVDHRDIDRAIDHAEMMTRITGKPTHSAVAVAGLSGVTESRIESGSVHWHRLPLRIFNPR